MITLTFLGLLFSFCTGAVIASFLNVVIWRVPRGESIVSPPSHCPNCNAPIRWYQNVPILSYLALRGRCAGCGKPISPRYILIETLGGCLFLAAFVRIFGRVPAASLTVDVAAWVHLAVAWIWIALMIAGSFIDFDHQLLPDFVTVGGMILGVLSALADSLILSPVPFLSHFRSPASLCSFHFPLFTSLTGLLLGFLLLWLIRFFGSKAFKREAMGLGDVFLMGAIGALQGPSAVLFTLIVSSLVGSLVGVALMALSKIRLGRFVAIPFGPFLCIGSLAWMLAGPELVRFYLQHCAIIPTS